MRSHAKAIVAVSAVLLLTLALAANPASALAPTVTIENASDVGFTTAKVKGTLDRQGQSTAYRFQYVTQASFEVEGWSSPATGPEATIEDGGPGPQPVPGPTAGDFAELTGLAPDTTYHLRLVAENADGSAEAIAASTLTTLAVAKPTVTLEPIASFDAESASFSGEVNPNAPEAAPASADVEAGFATSYRFECTPACPGTPEPQTLPADDQPTTVSFEPAGLEPNTDYTVKLFASNRGGEEVAERSFKTLASGPTVAPGTVGVLTTNSARLTAYVDANNTPSTATFEYATDEAFTSPVIVPSGPGTTITGNGNKVAFADISNLAPDTTYFWRVAVSSSEGTDAATAPRGFETWPTPGPDQGGVGVEGRRHFELVSTAQHDNRVNAADISADGERALYSLIGGSDQSSFGYVGGIWAKRTPTGWRTQSAMPPRSVFNPYGNRAYINAASRDLRVLTIGVATDNGNVPGPGKILRYEPETGNLELGSTLARAENEAAVKGLAPDDQSRLIALDNPEHIGGNLYDFAGPTRVEVGLLPGGGSPACGAANLSNPYRTMENNHPISVDGDRLFFISRGNDCDSPRNLYLREGGAGGTTTLVSGPALSGPERGGEFISATPDGSQAFFVGETRLDPADANDTSDLYRHTVGEGNACLTCSVSNAEVANPSAIPAALVAEHGDRAYFTSTNHLAPGALPGTPNLYVWRAADPGRIHFIAPIRRAMQGGGQDYDASATPSGTVMAFTARAPELDALTDSENNGFLQRYLYDDRSGALSCVSCPPGGASKDVSGGAEGDQKLRTNIYGADRGTPFSADGGIYVFKTQEPLDPADQDTTVDAYEWHNGQVGLITLGEWGTMETYPMSADGRDLLIGTKDRLLPDSPIGAIELYDARIGGGFPNIPPPTPCGGEGCRGPLTPAPGEGAPASAAFSGPANPVAKPCSKGKARKKGRCVKKKSRKHGKKQAKKKQSSKRAANSDRRASR